MRKHKVSEKPLNDIPIKTRAAKGIQNDADRNYVRTREFRNKLYYDMDIHPCKRRPAHNVPAEFVRLTDQTLDAFDILLERVPANPYKPNPLLVARNWNIGALGIMKCLAAVDELQPLVLDLRNQRRFAHLREQAASLLLLKHSQSEIPLELLKRCIACVKDSGSSLAASALIEFVERCNTQEQAEALADWGADASRELRNSIRRALKSMGREDLLPRMGTGGPKIDYSFDIESYIPLEQEPLG